MTSGVDKGSDRGSAVGTVLAGSQPSGTQSSGTQPKAARPNRRGFLVGAGAVAGAAGVAAVARQGSSPPAPEATAEEAATSPAQGRGYHVTEHVRKYYETTKV